MDDEEEEDDYIFYGTPLPEIEDEFVLRKKAAREQEVRDEKGRQRFHGAFTGGFSAGYFNTVGTKEGWAPSTFISSRSKTADRVQQNPEDFMDEEDLGEFGIATRKIHTSYKFKDSSNPEVKKRKFNELDSVIPGEAPLREIVKPIRDSIGVEILKKLGWRPGQGIGPRLKKHEKHMKVYGCSLPDSSLPEEEDPFALSFTFAPEDTHAVTFKAKDNYFGIGYTGLSKQSVLSARIDESNPTSTKSFLKKDKRKLAISGQAFGVGAFEDDDDDIYSKDDMAQYDFSDFDKESDEPSTHFGTRMIDKSSSGVLEGFRPTTQPSLTKNYYPPPELPLGFIPMFSKLSTQKLSHPAKSQHHGMTAQDRSFLLGESKFQPFQLKTPSLTEKESKQDKQVKRDVLNLSIDTASFKPFPNDSAKQKRYEEFLKLKNSGEVHKLILPSSMTEWEKQQELEEFARSAILFKPLSAALSSKFESRSHLSVEHEVMEAIEKAKKERTQKTSSVRKKLVGLQNRKTSEWCPSSLLCKRFNVPNPYPNSVPSGVSMAQQTKSLFDHITLNTVTIESADEKSQSTTIPPAISTKTEMHISPEPHESFGSDIARKSNSSTEAKPEENQTENERPPIDFFKDIFENTSSEEEEEDTNPEQQTESSDKAVQSTAAIRKKEGSKTVITNVLFQKTQSAPKRSGFGVFANLDLDALNQRSAPNNETEPVNIEEKQAIEVVNSNLKEKNDIPHHTDEKQITPVDIYGPELPPNYSELSSVSSKYHSKKHKVKHKHHHKHKSKKKRKKKSSHKSSEDDSSDSEKDISPVVILEKLKKIQKKNKI